MEAAKFQLYKVKRAIQTHGVTVTAEIPVKDEFGEPTGQSESRSFMGLYHETTSYLSKTTSDASTLRRKSAPMLLCLWDDVKQLPIPCKILHNGKEYDLAEVKDLEECQLIGDLSLEEVQYGQLQV